MTGTYAYTTSATTAGYGSTTAGDYPWWWYGEATSSTVTYGTRYIPAYPYVAPAPQIVERIVEVERHAHKCEYCGSECQDARGNCGACGAPLK